MKKIMMFLTLGIVLLLAACSGGGEATSTEANENSSSDNRGEKQVVTFWHSMGGKGQETLNSIVEDFNKSQDMIQVNSEYQGKYD